MRATAQRLEFIENHLDSLFASDLHAKRVSSLACGVLGVMTSASLAVSVIGHGHPRAFAMHRAEQRREGVAILNAGGGDLTFYRQAERIDRDMSFAALDFLAGVESARPAGFRCLDGLAIDNDGRRRGLAALGLTRGHHEHADDLRP